MSDPFGDIVTGFERTQVGFWAFDESDVAQDKYGNNGSVAMPSEMVPDLPVELSDFHSSKRRSLRIRRDSGGCTIPHRKSVYGAGRTGTFAISLWVKPFSYGFFVRKGNELSTDEGWSLRIEPDEKSRKPFLSFRVNLYPGELQRAECQMEVADDLFGTWMHVMGIVDRSAGRLHLYVNGCRDALLVNGTKYRMRQHSIWGGDVPDFFGRHDDVGPIQLGVGSSLLGSAHAAIAELGVWSSSEFTWPDFDWISNKPETWITVPESQQKLLFFDSYSESTSKSRVRTVLLPTNQLVRDYNPRPETGLRHAHLGWPVWEDLANSTILAFRQGRRHFKVYDRTERDDNSVLSSDFIDVIEPANVDDYIEARDVVVRLRDGEATDVYELGPSGSGMRAIGRHEDHVIVVASGRAYKVSEDGKPDELGPVGFHGREGPKNVGPRLVDIDGALWVPHSSTDGHVQFSYSTDSGKKWELVKRPIAEPIRFEAKLVEPALAVAGAADDAGRHRFVMLCRNRQEQEGAYQYIAVMGHLPLDAGQASLDARFAGISTPQLVELDYGIDAHHMLDTPDVVWNSRTGRFEAVITARMWDYNAAGCAQAVQRISIHLWSIDAEWLFSEVEARPTDKWIPWTYEGKLLSMVNRWGHLDGCHVGGGKTSGQSHSMVLYGGYGNFKKGDSGLFEFVRQM